MEFLKNTLDFIMTTLLQELVVVIAGVLFALLIQKVYIKWRYGKWAVILKHGGRVILSRPVSPEKARESLSDISDKAVFLKGIVSPYARLYCDIVEVGPKIGLLMEDKKARRWVIELDKNPPGDKGSAVE